MANAAERKEKTDKAQRSLTRLEEQMRVFRAKLQDPDASEEDIEAWEKKIDKIQEDMDDLTGGGPTPTPTV